MAGLKAVMGFDVLRTLATNARRCRSVDSTCNLTWRAVGARGTVLRKGESLLCSFNLLALAFFPTLRHECATASCPVGPRVVKARDSNSHHTLGNSGRGCASGGAFRGFTCRNFGNNGKSAVNGESASRTSRYARSACALFYGAVGVDARARIICCAISSAVSCARPSSLTRARAACTVEGAGYENPLIASARVFGFRQVSCQGTPNGSPTSTSSCSCRLCSKSAVRHIGHVATGPPFFGWNQVIMQSSQKTCLHLSCTDLFTSALLTEVP